MCCWQIILLILSNVFPILNKNVLDLTCKLLYKMYMERCIDIQANTHVYYNLYTHCITRTCALLTSSPTLFCLPSYTVRALPWHGDENVCFINFVTKSMHSIVQQGRQGGSRISMNSQCCVPVSPHNIREQYTGENNPQLNLHHLSVHRIISFQVNNLLSTLSYQVGL